MITKKIIGFTSILVVLLLVLANIPTVTAHVPGTNPLDPPLDPLEGFCGVGPWSFFYGHTGVYGSYLRDVQWGSPMNGWERYIGMVNIPYITIQGVNYVFAAGMVGKALIRLGAAHWQVVFTYPPIIDATGDTHNVQITFDIWHARWGTGTGFEATIDILAVDTIIVGPGPPPAGWNFNIPIRTDFDIQDIASPGLDDAFIYLPPAPGVWTWQIIERSYGPAVGRITDPVYGMEVMELDTVLGGWAGITPFRIVAGVGGAADRFHFVLYNPPPIFEYTGLPNPPGPSAYVNFQGIVAADSIIWDETFLIIPPPPAPPVGTITIRIWLW